MLSSTDVFASISCEVLGLVLGCHLAKESQGTNSSFVVPARSHVDQHDRP
jgi:hypothetical protein